MGTRSKTFVVEDLEKVENQDYSDCIAMYRQMDGYPDGHGMDLAEFLYPFTIVNGIKLSEDRKIANGLDCLAAQMVAHFKNGAGGIYLSANKYSQGLDYHYVVYMNKELKMQCWSGSKLLFDGTPQEFIDSIEEINKKNS